jgi:hypothetical protein
MKLAYCSFNLFGYEHITPPPKNLPKEFITFYVTDSVENVNESEKLGWTHGVLFEKFKDETDKFKKRIAVSYLKIFFDKILPDIENFDLVFFVDSNVVRLFDGWFDFVQDSIENKNSFVINTTKGWYIGNDKHRNTIKHELELSLVQARWSYNFDSMRKRVNEYIKELNELNESGPIVSAKYICWNTKHQDKSFIQNIFFEESTIHLQGNIILSYLSGKYPTNVRTFHTEKFTNGELVGHKIGDN